MSKKYVVRRGFLSFMTGVVGLSAMLGFVAGRNLPQEPKEDHQVATEIRMFIEDAIEDGEDIETIKHEANKMAKKHAMVVGFGYDNTVGIYKNLVTEEYPISSFSIGADKTSIH
jgi:hypothetical protein